MAKREKFGPEIEFSFGLNEKRGAVVAAAVHGLFLLVVIGGMLVDLFAKPPAEPVFELVALPEDPVVESVEKTPAMETRPDPAPLTTPDVPEMIKNEPLGEPEPLPPEPKPDPAPPPPAPVETPQVVKKISYEDFIRQQGRPQESPQRPQRRPQVKVREIDPGRVTTPTVTLPSAVTAPRVSASVWNSWDAALHSLLMRNFRKPPSLAGRALEAKVKFRIGGNGSIERVELVQSSGNPLFDEAVWSVFRKVEVFKPTPDGTTVWRIQAFRMREGRE